MRDFWSQVKVEDNFKLFLNNLPGVQVFVKDIQGKFIYVNDEARQAFGASSNSEIIGCTDHDVFGAKLAENYLKSDRAVIDEKRAQTNIVELVPNRHGQVEWVVTTKIPLFSHDGELMGILGTCQNFGLVQKNLSPYFDIVAGVEYMEKNYALSFS
ncbi:MAG: PAS domain-containing protein, partial [Planctomycetes bacterium]|nr:PAS domain-containing protein [Planctomycetota bacterium]